MPQTSRALLQLSLHPITAADEHFLRQLYREVRDPELIPLGWPSVQVAAFCDMQYNFRAANHGQYQPPVISSLVRVEGVAVGRVDVVHGPGEWTLVNVELLTAWRDRGLGRQLLETLQRQAAQAGVAILLTVEVASRAAAVYRRCGFISMQSDGFLERMVWSPHSASHTARSCTDDGSCV